MHALLRIPWTVADSWVAAAIEATAGLVRILRACCGYCGFAAATADLLRLGRSE